MKFEEKLKRLDEIVNELESGNVELKDINTLFNEGVELSKECITEINDTKGKITILQQELNKLIEKPIDM